MGGVVVSGAETGLDYTLRLGVEEGQLEGRTEEVYSSGGAGEQHYGAECGISCDQGAAPPSFTPPGTSVGGGGSNLYSTIPHSKQAPMSHV